MTKSRQVLLLLQVILLFRRNRLFPDSNSFDYYKKLVTYCHNRGWLYVGFDKEMRVDLAAIAFRIPEFTSSILKQLPDSENGNQFYVLALVSESKDRLKPLRMLKYIVRENPDIELVSFHRDYEREHLKSYSVNKEKNYAGRI